MNKIIEVALSLPKILYVNFVCFDFKTAIRLPIFVNYRTKIYEVHRGNILIKCPIKMGLMVFGFGGTPCLDTTRGGLLLARNSILILNGKVHFSEGAMLRNSGKIIIGKDFSANKGCRIACSNMITFGERVMLGWNVSLRDSDGHYIIHCGVQKPKTKSVSIGNHVWICSESHLLKGSNISDDSVVAYGSLVTRSFVDDHVLIAGAPASVKYKDINWEV